MNFARKGFKAVMVTSLLREDRQDPELRFYHLYSLAMHTILPQVSKVLTAPLLFTTAIKFDF